MKQRVRLTSGDTVRYDGRISDIPIKHNAIIQKSIELFDDDDPCIIHQSYVIKEYADYLLGLFDKYDTSVLQLNNIEDDTSFLDIDGSDQTLTRLGK